MPEWVTSHWVEILSAALSLIVGPAAVVWLGRFFAPKARVDLLRKDFDNFLVKHAHDHVAIENRLAQGEREFGAIKADLEHLPHREDIDRMGERITALTASVAALNEGVDGVKMLLGGINETVNMLMNHELAEGRQAKKQGLPS